MTSAASADATTREAMDEDLQAVCVRGPTTALGSDVLIHEHLIFDHTARLLPPETPPAFSKALRMSLFSSGKHCSQTEHFWCK